jgi:hypothetical protein
MLVGYSRTTAGIDKMRKGILLLLTNSDISLMIVSVMMNYVVEITKYSCSSIQTVPVPLSMEVIKTKTWSSPLDREREDAVLKLLYSLRTDRTQQHGNWDRGFIPQIFFWHVSVPST